MPEIDAFKQAMRGDVPVDQWRPPKPESVGAPQGGRGRGPGMDVLGAANIAYDAAVAEKAKAAAAFGAAAFAASFGDFKGLAAAQDALKAADEALRAISLAQVDLFKGTGSQIEDRLAEWKKWQRERLEKHQATRPNFNEWQRAKAVQPRAQDAYREARALAKDIDGQAGKGTPWRMLDAKINAKEAKEAAKEAKRAAKVAKNAAKYGTKEEAQAAAAAAERAAGAAEKKADHAKQQLLAARVEVELERLGKAKKKDGSGGKSPEDGLPSSVTDLLAALTYPECGGLDPMNVCIDECDPSCQASGHCVCTWAAGPPIGGPEMEGGGKGKGAPPSAEAAKAPPDGPPIPSTPAQSPAETPAPSTPEVSAESTEPEPPAPKEANPSATESETTEAELLAAAEKTLSKLAPLIANERTELGIALEGIQQLLLKIQTDRRLSPGQQKALERKCIEAAIHQESLHMLLEVDIGVRMSLAKGLTGTPAEREDSLIAVNKASWVAPNAVKAFLKEAIGAIGATKVPDKMADEIILQQRAGIEILIEERYQEGLRRARGGIPSREEVRNAVLDEMERGGAPGLLSLAVSAFGKAADDVLGRPVRFGILAARDALWGSPSTKGAWERAGEVGALTRELTMGVQDEPGLRGIAAFVGATAEVTGDVGTILGGPKAIASVAKGIKSTAAAKGLSTAERMALLFRETSDAAPGVSVHGGEAVAASSRAPRSWFSFRGDLGGSAPVVGELGPYPGRVGAFLDRFGIRQGYRSTIINDDALAGGSWFARTDTAVHEGVHVFVARYFPSFRDLSASSRVWAAAARYPEEVLAYNLGHAAALRPHGLLVAPAFEAFGSLSASGFTPAQQVFARWFWGTVGSGAVGAGSVLGYRAASASERSPPDSK